LATDLLSEGIHGKSTIVIKPKKKPELSPVHKLIPQRRRKKNNSNIDETFGKDEQKSEFI
jgi:hypothetical protein